jgi:hypothetical protein
VPQTGLDLRSVVTAAAAGQQHYGERQRSGQEDQANTERTFVHRLDSPAIQKGSQAGERDAPPAPVEGARILYLAHREVRLHKDSARRLFSADATWRSPDPVKSPNPLHLITRDRDSPTARTRA